MGAHAGSSTAQRTVRDQDGRPDGRGDRRFTDELWERSTPGSVPFGWIIFGIALGLAAGFTDGLTSASHDPLTVAVPVGVITGLVVGATGAIGAMITVSRTWSVGLLFGQLWLRGATPVRVMRFLQDAHRLGVLRVAGPVYQFRHARLQDRLASESD